MALTAEEERQIMMEEAVRRFFITYSQDIAFASEPSNRFHRFYILKAVIDDLSSMGYQIGKIGDFSIDLGTSLAVKDAKMLSERAGRRLIEYIYREILAFEEGNDGFLKGVRLSDGPGPLFLEGELPNPEAVDEKLSDILEPLVDGKPAEKLVAVVHVDGETIKKGIEERFSNLQGIFGSEKGT